MLSCNPQANAILKRVELEKRQEMSRRREEHKKRQEMFRKRGKSLFHKAEELAEFTDAWVCLIVRGRDGRVQSFRSSCTQDWPPSIQDLTTAQPTGPHKYLEKRFISGDWVVSAGVVNNAALDHSEAKSAEGIQEASGLFFRRKNPESTMSVHQHDIYEAVLSSSSKNMQNEHVPDSPANAPLEKFDDAQEPQRGDLSSRRDSLRRDSPRRDSPRRDSPRRDSPRRDSPRRDSPRRSTFLDLVMTDNFTFESGELKYNTSDDFTGRISTKTGIAKDEVAQKAGSVDNAPVVPGDAMELDTIGTAESKLINAEHEIMINFNIGTIRPQTEVEVDKLSSTLSDASSHHTPLSSESLSSRSIAINLLKGWRWVVGG